MTAYYPRPGDYIYPPAPRANEYCALAANPYRGCGHKCAYCYVPFQLHMKREEFDAGAVLRPTFFKGLLRDARRCQAAGITEQVLLSFTTDPYHAGDTAPTRETLGILREHGLGIRLLSKGGTRALRDLDLLRADRDCYGTTLTSLDDEFSLKWERNAPLPSTRIAALKAFHEAGIYTWGSLEPVLSAEHSLAVVDATHQFVDHYKCGAVNYAAAVSKAIDWQDYTTRLTERLNALGKSHYVKRALQRYLSDGYHNPLRIAQHH